LNVSGFNSYHALNAASPTAPLIGQADPACSIASNTRSSWHKTPTAATFKPKSFKTLDNFIRSQFSSVTVDPSDIDITPVLAQPLTTDLNISLLKALMLGDIADGTGIPEYLIVVSLEKA